MSERKSLFLMSQAQAAALALLVEAAEAGDGAAACRLGDMYREALGGVRYSPGKAFRWYARSAMAGDEDGQNNLGACYEHGIGCAQSYANAVKWYRRSASQGVSTAYMNLGYCYLRGHGVPADKAEALRLFREAVTRGESRAAEELERLGDEARIGRQAEQMVNVEEAAESRHAVTEQDLFPIFAECGMKPDDLVPETAARYAEYLQTQMSE